MIRFVLFVIVLTATGCVSKRKYNELLVLKNHYKEDSRQLAQTQSDLEALQQQLQEREAYLEEAQGQINRLSEKYVNLDENRADLADSYMDLTQKHETLIRDSRQQKESLLDSIQSLQFVIATQSVEADRLRLLLVNHEVTTNPDSLLQLVGQDEKNYEAARQWARKADQQLDETYDLLKDQLASYPVMLLREKGQIQLLLSKSDLFTTDNAQLLTAMGKKLMGIVGRETKSASHLSCRVELYEGAAADFSSALAALNQLRFAGLSAEAIQAQVYTSPYPGTPEEQMKVDGALLLLPQTHMLLDLLFQTSDD